MAKRRMRKNKEKEFIITDDLPCDVPEEIMHPLEWDTVRRSLNTCSDDSDAPMVVSDVVQLVRVIEFLGNRIHEHTDKLMKAHDLFENLKESVCDDVDAWLKNNEDIGGWDL